MGVYIKAADIATLEAVLEYLERTKETEADKSLLSNFRAYVEHCRALNERHNAVVKKYADEHREKIRESVNKSNRKTRAAKRKQKQEEQAQEKQ